jgi:hypothetical protein
VIHHRRGSSRSAVRPSSGGGYGRLRAATVGPDPTSGRPITVPSAESRAGTQHATLSISAREDPDALAFELHAILLGADTKFVLHDDPAVLDLARQIVRRRLGLDNGSNDAES